MAGMDMDLVTQLLSMRMGATQQAAQFAMVRKNHQMQMSLVDMLDQAVRSAPAPAGQGLVVDKRA
jgi:hypothetical protein